MKAKSLGFWIGAFIIFLFSTTLWAGTTGKIAGTVKDKDTGAPLPGVNIVIKGTTMGAASNLKGEYFIINVPVGTYTLEATMVGYKKMAVTDVKVSADLTTTVDFELGVTVIPGKVITVTAERAMVKRDVTSSTKIVEANSIQRMPVTNFDDVVAVQAGAVETGAGLSGGLHIRGGRTGDVVYYVDGINVTDPVSNTRGIYLDKNAIEEMSVISGGFNPEYGEAMSGVVNIVTEVGSMKKYGGRLELTTDAPFNGTKYDFGYNVGSANLSGPVPLIPHMSFFVSTAVDREDDRHPTILGKLPHNDLKGNSGTGKLLWKPLSNLKLVLNGNWGFNKWHSYRHANSQGNWLKDGYCDEGGNSQINLQIIHNLTKNTFYNLNIGRFQTFRHRTVQNGLDYTQWRAISPRMDWVAYAYAFGWYDPKEQAWVDSAKGYIQPGSGLSEYISGADRMIRHLNADSAWLYYYTYVKKWVELDSLHRIVRDSRGDPVFYHLGWKKQAYNRRWFDTGYWDIVTLDDGTKDVKYFPFDLDKYLTEVDTSADHKSDEYRGDIDQFFPGYDYGGFGYFEYDFVPWWHRRTTTNYTVDFSLASQIDQYNLLKFGGNYRKNDLKLTTIEFFNENPYSDHYHKKPIDASAYIQDKVEFEDMVLNGGFRFDYFDPQSTHYVNMDSLDKGKEETTPSSQISPRLGISFAVSDKTVLYAHYGAFFQHIKLRDLYEALNADVTTGVPILGDPGLKASKTVAYEIGLRHSFTPDLMGEITTYYKDQTNLEKALKVHTVVNNVPVTYTKLTTADFAVIKGIDVSLTKRASRFFSGAITYSYLNAKGTGSSDWEGYYGYTQSTKPVPIFEHPLEFDLTHTFKANLNLYLPKRYGPKILGIRPLSDLNSNLQFVFESGAPYTPEDSHGQPSMPGSKRMPATNHADLRMDKGFSIKGGLRAGLFLDVRNLFDVRNVLDVYSLTGRPDDNGHPPSREGFADETTWREAMEEWERRMKNPAHYDNPRIIRGGITLSF